MIHSVIHGHALLVVAPGSAYARIDDHSLISDVVWPEPFL